MSDDRGADAVPAPVHTAFQLFVGAAALAVTNAVLQLTFKISPPLVLVGATIEAALLVGFGLRMRRGNLRARPTMLSLALVFSLYSLAGLVGLSMAMRQGANELGALDILLLLIWPAKILLLVGGGWLMYRPITQGYFR